MTALEFELLAAFVRNQGRLLNRTQLLDLVWGTGTFVTDRVVDNHVVSLRRKIDPDPTQKRDVFVLALADLREWPLITHPANDQMVGWTSDGMRIAFSAGVPASEYWVLENCLPKASAAPGGKAKSIGPGGGRGFPGLGGAEGSPAVTPATSTGPRTAHSRASDPPPPR